ncbi:MAG: hypothetical protein ABGX16_07080 [Pirellulales bacterium]
MHARSITELACNLKSERIGIRRQMLLNQIWRMRNSLERELAISDGLDEQSSRKLDALNTQRKKSSCAEVGQTLLNNSNLSWQGVRAAGEL